MLKIDRIEMQAFAHCLISSWKIIIGWLIIFLVFGVVYIAFVPKKYEAVALVQPATVGMQLGSTKGTDVESPSDLAQRLDNPSFYQPNVVQACGLDNSIDPQLQLRESIKVSAPKKTNFVKLVYHSSDTANANACLTEVFEQIVRTEADIAEPIFAKTKQYHEYAKSQLEAAQKLRVDLETQANSLSKSGNNTNQILLMINVMSLKAAEIERLQKWFNELNVLIDKPLTQPAKLIQPISVTNYFSTKFKILVLICSAFVGTLLGSILVFVKYKNLIFLKPDGQ